MPVRLGIYGKHSNLTAFEIKTSVLQNAWPFYVYQSDQRAIEYISLMWTLLSDWHIRFAEGCLWYLKYSLFWCLVGGISITQCYFTQYLSITTLASTGLFMIVFHLEILIFTWIQLLLTFSNSDRAKIIILEGDYFFRFLRVKNWEMWSEDVGARHNWKSFLAYKIFQKNIFLIFQEKEKYFFQLRF